MTEATPPKRPYHVARTKHVQKPKATPFFDDTTALTLALPNCSICLGTGKTSERSIPTKLGVCYCVFRAIFRICYGRFRVETAQPPRLGAPTLEARGRHNYRFQPATADAATYIADFLAVSKRVIEAEGALDDYQLFRWHFVLGADWKLCCRRLGMERGHFFNRIYSIERMRSPRSNPTRSIRLASTSPITAGPEAWISALSSRQHLP